MGHRTRDEREDLIADDDGDPTDEVFVTTVGHTGAHGSYHTVSEDPDDDCWYVDRDTMRTVTRAQAQTSRRPPCKVCVLEDHDTGNGGENGAGGKSELERMVERGEIDSEPFANV